MPPMPHEGKQQEIPVDYLTSTLIVGLGATALMDLWSIARRRAFGVPTPNYGLVGRWLGHFPRGRFRHHSIAAAEPARGERLIGWTAHYLIGIAFAFILPGIWDPAWVQDPTLGPALLVGLATVAAPFLVMQPAMGLGLAASRTPRPAVARFHSLVNHGIFGLGLYVIGTITSVLHSH